MSRTLRRWASRGIVSLLAPAEQVRTLAAAERETREAYTVNERIGILVGVAAANGSTVSSEELRLLLPEGLFATADSLEAHILADPDLAESLIVMNGEIAPRSAEALLERRQEQRELAYQRIQHAERFTTRLVRYVPWIDLVAVSGSTAYGGAKPYDDIDFFLVAPEGRMWIALFVALCLARIDRSRASTTPVYCFNRITEREACMRSFDDGHDPLFAREALNLRVLWGHRFYRELVGNARWMRTHFPGLYEAALESDAPVETKEERASGPLWSALNALSFLGLAPYLWAAGLVRNDRLRRRGQARGRFRTVIARDFLAYESRKYDELREAYRRAF